MKGRYIADNIRFIGGNWKTEYTCIITYCCQQTDCTCPGMDSGEYAVQIGQLLETEGSYLS